MCGRIIFKLLGCELYRVDSRVAFGCSLLVWQFLEDFLWFYPDNHHSTIARYSLFGALPTYAIAQTTQHIIIRFGSHF
jgi:hypothetical protein